MAYEIRSLGALATQAKQFFVESVTGAIVDLWANTFRVFQKVLALASYELELRRKYLFNQIFASRADREWLIRHGFEIGILPKVASRAIGEGSVATVEGLVVPAGLVYARPDGVLFRVRTSDIGDTGATNLAFEAVEPGSAGNTGPGIRLTAVDPGSLPDGLGSVATVTPAGLGGGADAEALETFRARVLERKRSPPQGGSKTDWQRWAKEVGGVSDVYVTGFSNDDRSVWICFRQSGRTNGIPSAGDVEAVYNHVSDPLVRPVTARVAVVAPTPVPVDVQIRGLALDSASVRSAIHSELVALFSERMGPATPEEPFILPVAWISEAISRSTGEDRHTLQAPAGNVTFAVPGQLPVLGAISYA